MLTDKYNTNITARYHVRIKSFGNLGENCETLFNSVTVCFSIRNCCVRSERIPFLISSERFFEDHENVVEVLSDWTRDTENKVLFLEKEEKYAVFKNPQVR
jgi:hypothetical protein